MAYACNNSASPETTSTAETTGIKIAYVNGDSILVHYKEFKKESEAMELKQRAAEEQLQSKGAALEKEIMTYQQKAQTGTLTGKEMEAREKYLGSRQEALLAERDRMAQEIMKETGEINKRLQAVLQEKLNAIKDKEGFDFILSYVEGGPLLVADKKYDITDKVLKELNGEETSTGTPSDTTGKK
jgi:outer membrane protein